MDLKHRVRLFRNGRNQSIRIPPDLELPGHEATLRRDGDRLIIEPILELPLLTLLASLTPIADAFPDADERLPAAKDVEL